MSYTRGEARPSARLTEADVIEMRRMHSLGAPLKTIHSVFPQCSKPNIHHIVNGRRWKYLLEQTERAA